MLFYTIFSMIIIVTKAYVLQNRDQIRVINKDAIEEVVLGGFENADSIDWRQKGVILPVYSQGQCGDSVLLNALDALSAAATIQTGRSLQRLSQQQIYDCSNNPQLCNCEGSTVNASNVYNYLIKSFNGDVDSEASYPTTGDCQNICHFTKSGTAAQIEQYAENLSGDERILHKLLQYGPVTAAINAGLDSFQYYVSGIYEDPKCTAEGIDHVVLIVGYGTENEVDYWIARNSWGEDWGEKGYIRIARNRNNLCGVASYNSLPWRVNYFEQVV